jgi:hypothetical protein
MLLFFRTYGKAGSPFHVAGMALAIQAKRKGGQVIENKQLREMAHFAPPMISRTYDQRRETVRFARRKEAFPFAGFSASSRPKTQGNEIDGGFGARAADVAPFGDSEMAPQAVGIAQNGLGDGAAGSSRSAGEPIRRAPYDSPEAGVAHRIMGVTHQFAGEFVQARDLEHALAFFKRGRDDDLASQLARLAALDDSWRERILSMRLKGAKYIKDAEQKKIASGAMHLVVGNVA